MSTVSLLILIKKLTHNLKSSDDCLALIEEDPSHLSKHQDNVAEWLENLSIFFSIFFGIFWVLNFLVEDSGFAMLQETKTMSNSQQLSAFFEPWKMYIEFTDWGKDHVYCPHHFNREGTRPYCTFKREKGDILYMYVVVGSEPFMLCVYKIQCRRNDPELGRGTNLCTILQCRNEDPTAGIFNAKSPRRGHSCKYGHCIFVQMVGNVVLLDL